MSEQHALTGFSHVPERRSSRVRLKKPSAASLTSVDVKKPPAAVAAPHPYGTPRMGRAIRPKGKSSSPLRRLEPCKRKESSRTFVPAAFPIDLLYAPRLTHARILLDLRLSSPIFMGGATVEGDVHVVIDGGPSGKKRKKLSRVAIGRIFVTVVGIESCKEKQDMFRALMTDLLDGESALPPNMAPELISESMWAIAPSCSTLPFRLDLPVMMGPPPYESKKAGIRYLASVTVDARIAGKPVFVRSSREIAVLSVHDPEKALVSLTDPLLVTDELRLSSRAGPQNIVLSAGIHRQTWISGYPIFVDVHVDNQCGKPVKKIELQLEKVTMYHSQPIPATRQGTAESLRIPDHIHKKLVAKRDVSDGLQSIFHISHVFKTHQMEIPVGLVSIDMGRFFGVRYFVNIQISCTFGRRLKVQLPITIIHPNSIDIPTNALAQVAASIDHKNRDLLSSSGTGSPYQYRPGQAFSAARRKSYVELRKNNIGSTDLEDLTRSLEASPRRHLHRQPRVTPYNKPVQRTIEKRVTRRQSAVELGTNRVVHESLPQRQRQLGRASLDNQRDKDHLNITSTHKENVESHQPKPPIFSLSRRSKEHARVSFESPATATHLLQPSPTPNTTILLSSPPAHPPSHSPGQRQPRSSLEAKIHRGLRGLSIDNSTLNAPLFGISNAFASTFHSPYQERRSRTTEESSVSIPKPEGKQKRKQRNVPTPTSKYAYGPSKRAQVLGRGPRLQRSTSGLAFDASSSSPSSSSSALADESNERGTDRPEINTGNIRHEKGQRK